MNIPTLPRETIEFLPIAVTVDDVNVTTGVMFSTVIAPARPSLWTPAATVSGKIGMVVSEATPGLYTVYAKITGAGETPVILCGQYLIN